MSPDVMAGVEPGDGVAPFVESEVVVDSAAVVDLLPSTAVVVSVATPHVEPSKLLGKHVTDTLLCAQFGALSVTPLATLEHSDSIASVPLHTGDTVVGNPPKSWLNLPATAPATCRYLCHYQSSSFVDINLYFLQFPCWYTKNTKNLPISE